MQRNKILIVRLTQKELEHLNQMIAGKNRSAYVREKIFSGSISERDLRKELRELRYQVRKIGVNVNQVVAKINSSYASADDIDMLQDHLRRVEERFVDMMKKIEDTYGNH